MEEIITAAPTEEELAEQARIRREKLQKLTEEGNDPFVKVSYDVTANSKSVKDEFEKLEGKEVSLAGRLMSRRIMGKASFSHISDRDGLIQIYVRRDDVGEEDYASFKKDYDLGDIVGVKGYVFKTQTGEISIHCNHIEM
ncbi:MAG: lysine--tRNA ligase, partial [Clostridia bacterium]|nr:lysine--tRNA ligase [Clostridia bacterium]